MRTNIMLCPLLAVGLLVGCASERQSSSGTAQARLQSEARLSRADAEKAALARVPGGTIQTSELEREKGKLIWSFDIATPGTSDITEVAVDAVNGDIIEVAKENPAEQAKERAADGRNH